MEETAQPLDTLISMAEDALEQGKIVEVHLPVCGWINLEAVQSHPGDKAYYYYRQKGWTYVGAWDDLVQYRVRLPREGGVVVV